MQPMRRLIIISIFALTSVVSAQQDHTGATLMLPTVGVDTAIVTAPLVRTTWDVSHLDEQVGHLEGTAWLDAPGNVVLGGHSEDVRGNPSVFAALYDLEIGDPVTISADGMARHYIVTQRQWVDYTDLRPIYPTTYEQVTLLTCAVGTFNQAINNYEERLIIIARPLPPRKALPSLWMNR